ncbi:MATE family efflux transporter [Limibaculum sp. M0105]|uniref:MATE family efflux transporter n=1 Tax=Thermohalobaculum xanthum TaxID=2753746 RepID=A0A8J7M8X9_9RHOB|nr:MATE family efflux transporter [Thermohalobaculum xanthum]MBK0399960.1 MATE family efflux transporter [Thermohalobaculum xanthum]
MTDMTAPPPIAPREITYRRVAAIALPVVLSNATVPLQGAIDTAIIGNLGDAVFLAAVTLGAVIISLLFTSFNFLQMGVSGLTAQAFGADDRRRVMNTLMRALVIAAAIATVLIVLRGPISRVALMLFEGSAEAEALAGEYVRIRAWGAPAELAGYALIGWFTGQEMTRRLFEMQIVTSVSNIVLNLVLVLGLGMDVDGVALGTVIAVWLGLGYGLWRARERARVVAPEGWRLDWGRVLEPGELRQVMALNRDIFVRTVCLTGSFAWMARLGSLQGDVVLAANGVLMQFLYVSAYALDGFAMAAETLVGQALGARSAQRLRRSVVVSSLASLALAAGFALAATLLSGPIIDLFTNVEAVRAAARDFALWATLLPVAGVLAYQADGIFIGAAEGPSMRNSMLISAGVYFPTSWLLTEAFGNHGLWAGMWLFMLVRAGTLALRYGRIEARCTG